MKLLFRWVCLSLLCVTFSCGRFSSSYPEVPGNLFIRQQICDLNDFKKTFLNPAQNLKAQGFSAFSLHRDLKDPKTYILTLKCDNLKKAVNYIKSSNFHT